MREARTDASTAQDSPPRRSGAADLPGFAPTESVGLGDIVQGALSAIGVPSCGGCQRRAEAMNRWLTFSRRR